MVRKYNQRTQIFLSTYMFNGIKFILLNLKINFCCLKSVNFKATNELGTNNR